jgi:hypothetical protein
MMIRKSETTHDLANRLLAKPAVPFEAGYSDDGLIDGLIATFECDENDEDSESVDIVIHCY